MVETRQAPEPILVTGESRDERIERLELLARMMDEAFTIPGTGIRVGWDSIIGLIPGVGDAITAAISAYIVNEARRLGVSRVTLARMWANVALDATLGALPLVGDVFDVAFKANRKNLELLRKKLQRSGKT